ncbi:MAG TPA: response regulator transcription factor [Opitutaceae bacterium]|jgi:two-component system copper resistance phosphate regulon response regulator CusR
MRFLIVEDEREVADMMARGLKSERCAVDVVAGGDAGWAMTNTYEYDLVILDLMPPGMEGHNLLTRIRAKGSPVPILILAASDSPEGKVKYFEAGADDYLSKPFAIADLQARIKVLLRRGPVSRASSVRVGDLEVDRITRQARRAGRRLELTPTEYALLEYLATQPRRVFSRTMIVEHVWDGGFEGLTNIVDVYMRNLRGKVDDDYPTKLIRTIRGVGYSLSADPVA